MGGQITWGSVVSVVSLDDALVNGSTGTYVNTSFNSFTGLSSSYFGFALYIGIPQL